MTNLSHYILRAQQKDDYYSQLLYERLVRIIETCKTYITPSTWGLRRELLSATDLTILSKLIYGLCTIWGSGQTLGEEYTQLNEAVRKKSSWIPPSNYRRLILVLLECLPNYLLRKIFSQLKESSSLSITHVGSVLNDYLPVLSCLHLALFFLKGTYMSLAKRVMGIRLIRNSEEVLMATQASWLFRFVALLLILQTVFKLCRQHFSLYRWLSHPTIPKSKSTTINSLTSQLLLPFQQSCYSGNCLFCLSSPPVHPTIPICGHVFCWDCIVQWCSTNPACPMCRVPCQPQQLLPLRHYSPSAQLLASDTSTDTTEDEEEKPINQE